LVYVTHICWMSSQLVWIIQASLGCTSLWKIYIYFFGIHQGEQIKSCLCALFTITSFYKAMNPNLVMKFWQTFSKGFHSVLYSK